MLHRPSRLRQVALVLVPLLAIWPLAAPLTAAAAPGDASAVGVGADLTLTLTDGATVVVGDQVGLVTAPPDGSATLVDAETAIEADLGILGVQTLAQAALVVTTATSNAAGSAATAQVEEATISTAAGLLVIDVVGSAVSCPTAGTPTSDVTPPATVTLDGTTIELDADGETVVTVTTTDPVATVSLTLSIDEQTTTTETAAATALVLGIEQNIVGVSTTSGTVTLAQTSCEAPLPPPPPPIVEPVAESLDPSEGPEAGGTTVTIQGSGFVPGETTVTIGGITIPAEDVQVSADGTSLTFVTPPHAPGQVDVTVTTPGGTSGPLTYTYLPAAPPPAGEPVTESLDPATGPEAGGTTVTIQGSGFVPGETTVTIGGITIPAEDVQVSADGTSLTFVTPPHAPGQVQVTVSTPGGTSGALTFTYVAAEPPPPVVPPVVEALGPVEGPATGGTRVTIEGSGFVSGETSVTIGGTVLPPEQVTVSDDGTMLTFITPPHAAGTIEVTVTTPAGTTGPLSFTYLATVAAPDGGALPETGAPALPLLATGLALALSGAVLVALGRGRTTGRAR